MIKSSFNGGGFVLHKIPTRAGATHLSAWFDKEGNLLDVEAVNILGVSYRAAQCDKDHCARLGKVWKDNKESN